MLQQGALAARADARDLIQRIGSDRLGALLAVAADGEAVRLVAQPLQVVEHRAFLFEAERRLARPVEMLVAGVALGPFGDRRRRHAFHPEIGEHLGCDGELARSAVDQHEVGALGLGILVLLHQPREAARQDFAHHAGVVAGGKLGALDVVLAVFALLETVRPGHDHRPHRVRPHHVAVVVDFDTPDVLQSEQVGHAFQEFALGGILRHAAGELLAGIGERHRHQLVFFAALGHHHLHPVLGAQRQGLAQQFAIGNVLGQ